MTRIFIEGYELDLTQGLSNQITYAIDDLQNLDSKSTAFTKTIVLPGTANNNKLLGNIFEFNNANFFNESDQNVLANFNASVRANARIEVDGLQIMKGTLRLLEIIHVDGAIEYECAIFGELGGFISALGNLRLEDLDFSDYNHNYNVDNITASWEASGSRGTNNSAAYGSGYYYPLIDYGADSTNKIDFKLNAFRPSFFAKEYIDKMFQDANYTYTSTFLNSTFFKSLLIPNNQKEFSKKSSIAFKVLNEGDFYTNESGGNVPIGFSTTTTLGNFNVNGTYDLFTYNTSTVLTGSLNLTLKGSIVYGTPIGIVSFKVLKNGVVIHTQNTTATTFDLSIVINEVSFTLNDTLQIAWSGSYREDTYFTELTIDSGSVTINSVAIYVPFNHDDPITVNDTIPKGIFLKDFFTSIMKMFNLLVYEDKFTTNNLIIEPYKDFFTNERIDWSNKLDRSKPIKLKPMSELNARYYKLKYAQDNDFYNENYRKAFNEGYADRIYDTAYEFSKDSEDVSIIFAPSVLYKATGTDKTYPTIYKKSNNNAAEDRMDSVIRIGMVKKITDVANWRIQKQDGSGNWSGILNAFGYFGHLNDPNTPTIDLNFGAPLEIYFTNSSYPSANLFNTYYSQYMSEITDKDSRLLTGFFDLTNIDIFNLDFAKYIFLQGGLYKLIKVYDYSAETNDTTKVDLLRVIDAITAEVGPTTTTTTTTTSTTTTTTTLATFIASYSEVSAYDVCNNVCPNPARPVETFTILAGGNSLCTATELTSPGIVSGDIGPSFWVSDCTGTSRQFIVILESGVYVAIWAEETCQTCPSVTTTTTSTTTTTTTAAPTTTTSTTTTTTTAAPTTTTSTTTTTTTDPYDYYIADEIDCSNCSVVAADQRVSFPTGTSVTLNRYYRYVGFDNDFTYYVKSATTAGGAVLLELPSYTTCNAACGNTTTTSTTTTTTTAATTTTSTTTTTTTYAPIALSATPGCTGGAGTGTVTANGFNGGSESFEYIAISSSSSSDALSRLDNSATRDNLLGATEFTYTMLANATYYVAIMDNVGNKGVSSGAVVNCVTTTTTSTTTTTTTAATTTTTSTTTTTTTLGYAFVDIANNTAGTDITNITVGGVQVDGAVFPIVAGDGASATTTETGASKTIVVSYTNISNDSVEVIDTASNLNCASATSTSRSFAGQVVSDGGTLSIQMFDGSC
jgi:hypothetical protein